MFKGKKREEQSRIHHTSIQSTSVGELRGDLGRVRSWLPARLTDADVGLGLLARRLCFAHDLELLSQEAVLVAVGEHDDAVRDW